MFVDASTLLAILIRETGYRALDRRIEDGSDPHQASLLNRFESAVILADQRLGKSWIKRPDQFLFKRSRA